LEIRSSDSEVMGILPLGPFSSNFLAPPVDETIRFEMQERFPLLSCQILVSWDIARRWRQKGSFCMF